MTVEPDSDPVFVGIAQRMVEKDYASALREAADALFASLTAAPKQAGDERRDRTIELLSYVEIAAMGLREQCVPPPEPLPSPEVACSFCGKGRGSVNLVAGPDAFICNECVELCVEIFADQKIAKGQA